MRRAIELAEKGRGWTSPNPVVGAVIVKDGDKDAVIKARAFGRDGKPLGKVTEKRFFSSYGK